MYSMPNGVQEQDVKEGASGGGSGEWVVQVRGTGSEGRRTGGGGIFCGNGVGRHREGKNVFVESDMARNDNFPGGKVEASVSFLFAWVP